MRTLKFIVEGQTLRPDPTCDFSNLVPGSSDYLQAEFDFSAEWDNRVKVVGFFSNLGKEYEPQVLKNGKYCVIPSEALAKSIFKVQIIGHKLCTNKVIVHQKGGKV